MARERYYGPLARGCLFGVSLATASATLARNARGNPPLFDVEGEFWRETRLSAGGDWIRTSGTRATLALLQPKAPAPEPMVLRLSLLYEDGFYTPSYSCETSLFVWSVSIDTAIRPITPQPRM